MNCNTTHYRANSSSVPGDPTNVAGTSFSAPIVAAATLWTRTVRPDLTPDQLFQVMRLSATDIKRKGYDPLTGYGKLNLNAALTKEPPIADPLEPNENMGFVNGRAFGKPKPLIWGGGRAQRLQALLDYYEDPGDIYRLRVPRKTRVTVTTKPDFGDPDLELFPPEARSFQQKGLLLDRSRRGGQRADTVTFRNRRGRSRVLYVRAFVRGRKTLDSRYTLTVR